MAYLWDHIIAIVALGTTLGLLIARSRVPRRVLMVSLNSVEKLIPVLVQAASQAAAYETGKALTIVLPPETVTLDLTHEGLGRISVSESGTTLVLQKAP